MLGIHSNLTDTKFLDFGPTPPHISEKYEKMAFKFYEVFTYFIKLKHLIDFSRIF